jgi:hypothetical protein
MDSLSIKQIIGLTLVVALLVSLVSGCIPAIQLASSEYEGGGVNGVGGNGTETAGWTYTTIGNATWGLDPTKYSGGGVWRSANETQEHPAWYLEGNLPPAEWVSTYDYYNGPNKDLDTAPNQNSWRLFREWFVIPSCADNLIGNLTMAADNAVAAYLNGVHVGNTSYVYGDINAPGYGGASAPYPFEVLAGPFDLAPALQTGNNTLMFVVHNWAEETAEAENPCALLYRADIAFDLPDVELTKEGPASASENDTITYYYSANNTGMV